MKPIIITTALAVLTAGAVAFYPAVQSLATVQDPATKISPVQIPRVLPHSPPKIEVVFVLDTTSSMSGMIDAAKEKIWSIASTMASAQPAPELSVGLVAYRDRGDAYVTRVVDLSTDLDSLYTTLMALQAKGGGDGPESVNQALDDAINRISWSQDPDSYQTVFLVGDAPPHMDYPNDVKYPTTLANARTKGIVVNAIQCGNHPGTRTQWNEIASLSQGRFFNVAQSGSAVAVATPYDIRLAALSAELDDTRLYYGSDEERAAQEIKIAAVEKAVGAASPASQARRAAFNASATGSANFLGDSELVDDISAGRVRLDEIDTDALPEPMKAMSPAEQEEMIVSVTSKRDELQRQIKDLAAERDDFIEEKAKVEGGFEESLDYKIFSAVKEQAGKKGMVYADAPTY